MLDTDRLRYRASHFFEAVVKIGGILRPQAVTNVSNAPVGMLQEHFSSNHDRLIDQCYVDLPVISLTEQFRRLT